MTGEDLSFEDLSDSLRITVQRGRDSVDGGPITDIRVNSTPPLSEGEYIELLERNGPDTELGKELVATMVINGVWVLSVDGEPSERQINLGELAAREIALIRGLAGAAFVDSSGETPIQKVVAAS